MTTQPATKTSWSTPIRRLHFMVALLVTTQITIGLVMGRETPRLVRTHYYLGLTIAALVLWHWIWLLTRERNLLSHLFPWSRHQWAEAISTLGQTLKGKLPQSGPGGSSLVGVVHGLGLLALTAVAALGTTFFIVTHLHHGHRALAEAILDAHATFAWILIIYWCGHVLLAVIHEIRGDRVISRMFGHPN